MKNKKILFTTLVVVAVLLSALLFGCDTSKLEKTGGTTDGSPITADTDPAIIVSQKVTEKQWNEAIEAYKHLQNSFPLTDREGMQGYQNVSMIMTIRYNKELFGEDDLDSVIISKSTQTTGYTNINNHITYSEYDIDNNKYYAYSQSATGSFTKREIPISFIEQLQNSLQQLAIYNDFKSFKYDKETNAYTGKVKYDALVEFFGAELPDGVHGKITVKLVNGLPIYLKQELINEEQTIMVGESMYFDFNTTVVDLPKVD